jgi:formylmethanofuran dehydrogenase subunit E
MIIDREHEECEKCGRLLPLDGDYVFGNRMICDDCLDEEMANLEGGATNEF